MRHWRLLGTRPSATPIASIGIAHDGGELGLRRVVHRSEVPRGFKELVRHAPSRGSYGCAHRPDASLP